MSFDFRKERPITTLAFSSSHFPTIPEPRDKEKRRLHGRFAALGLVKDDASLDSLNMSDING